MINVVVTDVGEFPAPDFLKHSYAQCRLRKDGRVDRRTHWGKIFYQQERTFMADKVGNWLADKAIQELGT